MKRRTFKLIKKLIEILLYLVFFVTMIVCFIKYANADDAGKKELTPQILQLEKKQSQLHEQCNELLQSTRKTESEVVQQ